MLLVTALLAATACGRQPQAPATSASALVDADASATADIHASDGSSGARPPSRATIRFEPRLPASYVVEQLRVTLDGQVQFDAGTEAGTAVGASPIFSGGVPVGEHEIGMLIRLQGGANGFLEIKQKGRFTTGERSGTDVVLLLVEPDGGVPVVELRAQSTASGSP